MDQALQPCQARQRIRLQATSTPSANTQNHPNSTHVAAMIYYRKTLSSSGPKLTAVHAIRACMESQAGMAYLQGNGLELTQKNQKTHPQTVIPSSRQTSETARQASARFRASMI